MFRPVKYTQVADSDRNLFLCGSDVIVYLKPRCVGSNPTRL